MEKLVPHRYTLDFPKEQFVTYRLLSLYLNQHNSSPVPPRLYFCVPFAESSQSFTSPPHVYCLPQLQDSPDSSLPSFTAISIKILVTHTSLSQGCDTDYQVLKVVFLMHCPDSVFHNLDKPETNNLKLRTI